MNSFDATTKTRGKPAFGVVFFAAVLALTCAVLAVPGLAAAFNHGDEDLLYLVTDRLGSSSQNPLIFYRAGRPITVTRQATGVYRVQMPETGMTASSHRGNVQVTAVGGEPGDHCSVGATSFSSTTQTQSFLVYCFSKTSLPADSRFSLSFVRRGDGRAYLLMTTPTKARPEIEARYDHNSRGANSIQRHAAGIYEVWLPGIAEGVAALTPYKSGNRCEYDDLPEDDGVSVYVYCTNASGAHADTAFSLVYEEMPIAFSGVLALVARDGGIYLQAAANGQPLDVRWTAKGRYQVTVPYRGGQAMGAPTVTGYFGSSCKIESLTANFGSAPGVFNVICVDPANPGAPKDGAFSFLLRIP